MACDLELLLREYSWEILRGIWISAIGKNNSSNNNSEPRLLAKCQWCLLRKQNLMIRAKIIQFFMDNNHRFWASSCGHVARPRAVWDETGEKCDHEGMAQGCCRKRPPEAAVVASSWRRRRRRPSQIVLTTVPYFVHSLGAPEVWNHETFSAWKRALCILVLRHV